MKEISLHDVVRGLAGLLVTALMAFGAGLPAAAQEEASIAAVVNEDTISTVDLAHRTNLLLFAAGLPHTEEVARRLQPQVLKTMIDETLQLQAAESANVKVSDREIDAILGNMELENRLSPGGLGEFLKNRGVEKSALERQIRANLAWSKLVERRFTSQASVGEDEVDDELARIEANQGQPRSLVSEIFLAVDDPSQDAQVRQSADRIIQQLRNGAAFNALARAFSQNEAAATGGDLGWLTPDQIDPAIRDSLAAMQPGQLAGPFRALDGYHILALRDRKLPGGSSPDQVTVDLRQINLPLSQQADEQEIREAVGITEQIRANIEDCRTLENASLPGGASVVEIGRVRIGDLAAPLQAPLMGLQANQISQPLRAPSGIMLLMVCNREAESAALPSRDQVKERLMHEKLDLLQRRFLRDLRRAAFLDVRV